MYYNEIFNEDTINVFTDGSIIKNTITNETIGSPGCLIVHNSNGVNSIIEQDFTIVRNATNNITELSAILLGVYKILCLGLNKQYRINLFSDSQLCINSLRTWIFNWINNIYGDIMYSSSGNPVANQEIILTIISLILTNNLNIRLYHQKGHVTSSQASLKHASEVFIKSNNIVNVDPELIRVISDYNNMVDIMTKQHLIDFTQDVEYNIKIKKMPNPMKYDAHSINFNEYSHLINKL